MKTNIPILCAGLLLAVIPLRADSLLKPNDLVAIGGDSITQQKQYSVFIEDYLLMCQPVPGVRTLQFGSNGAGAYVMGQRTPHNLELFHPTVVTMMYGMNDGQYKPLNDERAAAFCKGTNGSIEALKKIGVRTILVGSPSCVDWVKNPDGTKMYNKTLASFGEMSREIAKQQGAVFADVHGVMEEAIAKGKAASPDFNTGGDGTHAGPGGHLMMASAFLKAMGCDGTIGTITVELASNKAEGTPGQKITSARDGTITIESTRYPFCFTGDPDKVVSTTANVVKFLPFNQELNRYLLVVHGLKGAKTKVTWGVSSREFAAADLEKGVNLAAAFIPDNPFSEQFAKVDAAVREQQAQETTLTWAFLTHAEELKKAVPTQEAAIDKIAKGGLERSKALFEASAALVVPVQHTIKIEQVTE